MRLLSIVCDIISILEYSKSIYFGKRSILIAYEREYDRLY